jgi:plastocyanin
MNVDMIDIDFVPTELTIPANTDVTITLPNKGAAIHNFVIEELGIKSPDAQGGQTVSVTINAPAGTYSYICTQPGHKEAGMVGTLTVQ